MHTLSSQISDVFISEKDRTVGDLLDSISTKSYGFMFLVLTIPSALPVPAPGYSTPFGIVLTLLGMQYVAGRKTPWFPQWLRNKNLKATTEEGKLYKMIQKFITFFENFIKPRKILPLPGVVKQKLFGAVMTLCSMSMILPIPLTNTLPSLGICLISIGFLEEDELFEVAGLIIGILGICVTLTILFFGASAINVGLDWITSLF